MHFCLSNDVRNSQVLLEAFLDVSDSLYSLDTRPKTKKNKRNFNKFVESSAGQIP